MVKKLHSLKKGDCHLGSIICEKILVDSDDGTLMFMNGTECIAYFHLEQGIEVYSPKLNIEKAKSDFTEYQSNRI